ncbi:MAG: hypothetical protein QM497_10845 [Sulfurimonas sp.]
MDENNLISTEESKVKDAHSLLKQAKKLYLNFFDVNYTYSPLEASQELGLESELVQQLVQEYVTQLLQANISFREYLTDFKHLQKDNQELDFTPFQNLAHKNLGVARNLRIKDCEDILHGMMNEDNLDYLSVLIEVLESCAIKLSPTTAFNYFKE